jgi:hypothetical protein
VTKVADDLFAKYLKRLERELAGLPRARRREITDEIMEHLVQANPATEADARNVLERLGDPAEIADEARSRFGIQRPKSGAVEILALVLLPLGGLVFLVGWFVGVALLWGSNVWSTREKLMGTLIVPGGLVTPIVLMMSSIGSQECGGYIDETTHRQISHCTSSGPDPTVAFMLLAVAVIGPIVTVAYLARQMRRRTA